MNQSIDVPRTVTWRTAAAGLGLAWSLYGVFQFFVGTTSSEAGLMASGMTAEQAALYAALPAWMTIAFAIGVFGGVVGSGLLLARYPAARAALAASLAGYIILFVGDITHGVFAAFGPPQVIVLSLAIAIAGGLLWLAGGRKA